MVLTKSAKMTNLNLLTNRVRYLLLGPSDRNDEHDENGGCHAGEGMVYQKHGFSSLTIVTANQEKFSHIFIIFSQFPVTSLVLLWFSAASCASRCEDATISWPKAESAVFFGARRASELGARLKTTHKTTTATKQRLSSVPIQPAEAPKRQGP